MAQDELMQLEGAFPPEMTAQFRQTLRAFHLMMDKFSEASKEVIELCGSTSNAVDLTSPALQQLRLMPPCYPNFATPYFFFI